MNGSAAKAIRNHMYYPKKRTYYITPAGVILADVPRRKYQQAKKAYLKQRRNPNGQT